MTKRELQSFINLFGKVALVMFLGAGAVRGCFDQTRYLSDYAAQHRPNQTNQLNNE